MYKTTTDDIYAYALSKTLTKVSSPATVGLYSSCQNRINMILEQMEVYMKREASRIEKEDKGRYRPRSATPSICGFLALIGRMLFYRPILTMENQHHHNVRFIYVHFSAWHFAGSDLLWAGLAIRLFQAMQMNFGKLHLALYRVAQYDEEDEVKRKIVEDGPSDWRSKKICCCPLWFLVLTILVIPISILLFWLIIGFPQPEMKPGAVNGTKSHVGVGEGLLIAALGVPAASALKFIFSMCKNLIFTLDLNIMKGMDNERVSKQLGFMNEVRKEMWFLSQFIQFMEVFERRRIRVMLKITNLDRCSPEKIVAVLDAINILLSNEESPYISILAINPDVVVKKVNFADGCFSKEDRAYALLNHIVTLPFTVPPLCNDSKHSIFCKLTGNSKIPEDIGMSEDNRQTGSLKKTPSPDLYAVEIAFETKEAYPLIDKNTEALDVKEEEVEKLLRSILTNTETSLNKYMIEDAMSMRRAINTFRVTVTIMKALKKELPQPEFIAAWVVLANQWPCRLSWIIQCVEDAEQSVESDSINQTNVDDSKTLWKVFSESRAELYVMSAQIEELLEQDGDPEMFERFLMVDFQFTIRDLKTLEVVTVNLDHSIRRELAHIRGTSRLKDSGWMRNLAPLSIATIIKMTTEDVCKELERMEYPSKYIDIVRRNDLNGSALIFGDVDDLKALLDMTFGEWATFKLHFQGSPRLRPQYRNTSTFPSHPQLSGFPLHVRHHYMTNPGVVNNYM
ncbi:NTPase KAP family P-loop domain-containing protein 1 [Plectropomus leopardus]|uniref:NTPase KAP family P-loop domain-containing protein 1 n=1 Tax=Plectropomus leopardus TaxID=160734 RepID=UPI001C4C6F3B|nr:NTPase KAP family P-loop domain-containing protein 1 [Plectropomus leopardus]